MASDSVQRCECVCASTGEQRSRRVLELVGSRCGSVCARDTRESNTQRETAGRRAERGEKKTDREREREREREEKRRKKEEEEEEEEGKREEDVASGGRLPREYRYTRGNDVRERKRERGLLSRTRRRHNGPKEPRLRSLLNFLLGAAGRAEPSGMRERRQKPTKRDGERR